MTASLLIQFALKGALILMAGWIITASMRRGSAASRHLVWTVALTATLALPLVRALGPTWYVAVPHSALTAVAATPVVDVQPLPVQESAVARPSEPARTAPEPAAAPLDGPAAFDGAQARAFDGAQAKEVGPYVQPTAAETQSSRALSAVGLALLIWAAGAAFLLIRLAYGLVRAHGIARQATPVTDESWLTVFDEAAARLRVARRVQLRVSDRTSVPVACGIWKPTVLIPREASAWSEQRRLVVLLHELAHVRRRDCLIQAVAQVASAMHWINPLVHVAVARLRSEQERACDDLVLASGTDAPEYADHLFEIARAFKASAAPAWATLAMARPSQLEGRLMAILDEQCNRAPLARRMRLAIGGSAAVSILLLGALSLTAEETMPRQAASASDVSLAAAVSTARRQTIPVASAQNAIESFAQPQPSPEAAASPVAAPVPRPVPRPIPTPNPNPAPGADRGHVAALIAAVDTDIASGDSSSTSTSDSSSSRGGFLPALFAILDADQQPAPQARPAQPQTNQAPPVTDETRRRVADALATALTDENEDVREQALNSLASMRDVRAVPALLKALRDPSADLRETAVNGLAQFDTPEAIDGLVSALKDNSPDVREHAARHVMARIGRGQIQEAKYADIMRQLLKDDVADVREQAAMALGRTRNPQMVPSLLPLLKDPAVDVRERTAQALGMIGDPSAIDSLTAALKDADAGVREQAAMALGQIARGQRRNDRFGPVPPVPPVPPAAPRPIGSKDFERKIEKAATAALSDAKIEKLIEQTIETSINGVLDVFESKK